MNRIGSNDDVQAKVKLNLQSAVMTQKGTKSIALLFFILGARRGEWSTPLSGSFTP
jgi:hypothetical protein